MGYSKLKIPKICEHCKQPFEAKTFTTRYCSRDCNLKAANQKQREERAAKTKEKKLAEDVKV